MRRPPAGFTLIELVVTVVLLAFGALGISQFLGRVAETYVTVSQRESTTQVSRIAVERISRELRRALPGSIRVSSDATSQCIEFLPIEASSRYLDLPLTAPAASFQAADFPFTPRAGVDYYVAVYTLDPVEVYATGSANLTALDDVAAVDGDNQRQVNLAAPHQFAADSPAQRFFIVTEPVSFCASAGALTRHAGYGFEASQPLPPGGGVLLAEQIQLLDGATAVTAFAFAPPTIRRAGLVSLDFRFLVSAVEDEWVRVSHEIFVRNTP
jgi:MSHA biogenesis protein MshO